MDVHDWYFHRTFAVSSSISPDFFSLPLGRQVLLAWSNAFNSGATIAFGCNLMAAIVVASGVSRPQSWPPIFGSLLKGYTMRNIWGYCWHQLHRRSFETANSCLIRILRVKKGTVASRLLQLYNAFFVSAILHHIGSLNQPYSPMVWCQFAFFMMQPVAITIEDFAISFGRSIGLKENRKTRALGYAWVGVVLSFTLRYAAAAFTAAGVGGARHPVVAKFSIMERVFG